MEKLEHSLRRKHMIRVCRKEEYTILIGILRESFAVGSADKLLEDKFGKLNGFEWWERKTVDIVKQIEDFPAGVFVEELEGEIAGFITTSVDKKFLVGRIWTLCVRSKFQGKGIGTRLIKHAFNMFKENNINLARIEVIEENPKALELYKKLGFEPFTSLINLAMKIK